MSSLTMLEAIKETERIGKEYTDRKVQEVAGTGSGGSTGNYPPYSGIPREDLSRDVRNSLERADSALQPGEAEATYQPKGNYPTRTEMADAIAAAQIGGGSGAPVNATAIKYTPEGGEETTVAAALTEQSEEIVRLQKLDLIRDEEDGKIYITINGEKVGEGLDVGDIPVEEVMAVVFSADFSGAHPLRSQFGDWNGRDYAGAIYDSVDNVSCSNGEVHLTSLYNQDIQKWVTQTINTAGIFESDKFICEFKAKYSGLKGAWQNVITYGTGTIWSNGLYSDGVKWPAGGEIDAFEQDPDTPTSFAPAAHYGAGTASGYPNAIEHRYTRQNALPTDRWVDCRYVLDNGRYAVYIDDRLIVEEDLAECEVSNNYLWKYKPFLHAQAFYLDGQRSNKADTTSVFDFAIKDFVVKQDTDIPCNSLEIYPQMWEQGTNIVFPVGAEIFFEKKFYPIDTSNKACVWRSSDPTVASVVQGYVKVLKAGNTTITATCGTAQASYNLVCSASANVPCAGIVAEKSYTTSTDVDTQYYIYPKFCTDAVSIVSRNPDIVQIEGNTMKPVANGSATVVITCGNVSENVSVEVAGLSDTLEPYIAYDFAGASTALAETFASWDKVAKTIPLTSIGQNSAADVVLQIDNSSDYIKPSILCQKTETLIQNTDSFAVFFGNVESYMTGNGALMHVAGTNVQNDMPGVKKNSGKFTAFYGDVNPYAFDTNPGYIIMGHDADGYYLYSDGAMLKTGSGTGYMKPVRGLYGGNLGLIYGQDDLTKRCTLLENLQFAVFKADRRQVAKMAEYFGY